MISASIDLGTNTCLMLLAEVESGQVTKVLGDYIRTVRLGEGVDQTKCLQSEAMERTFSCLSDYKKIISEAAILPNNVVSVATSQARDAINGEEFFAKVEAITGFRFKILSGNDEARFTFLGSLLPGMDPSRYIVIDHGGGSTEFVAENGGQSVDLGSVRYTERYLKSDPVTDEEFWNCHDKINTNLEKLLPWRSSFSEEMQMLAVAGTATTLASWYLNQKQYDASEIEKVQMTKDDLHYMVDELKCKTVAERRDKIGIEPGRADVLLAGAMIIWRAMENLNFPSCRVSPRGLRYGVLSHLTLE